MKVIVIGGGVIGLTCAWRLAQQGAQVDLLEERRIGVGASSAALGALWPPSPLLTGPQQEMHRQSLWCFEAFIREIHDLGICNIPFRRAGRIELLDSPQAIARAEKEVQTARAQWPRFGDQPVMELLDPGALRSRFPDVQNENHPGLLCRATAQVNVQELLTALATACIRAGVKIREGSKVDRFRCDGQRIAAVCTANGDHHADCFLACAGAWTPSLDESLRAAAPIRPVKGQGIALERPTGIALEGIIKSGPTYLVLWDQEILVGSSTEPEAAFDDAPTEEVRDRLLADARQLVPALAGAKVLRHWAGLRPQNTAKGHPSIMARHPTIENLYICAGHYKTGIGLAPLAAEHMARLILP